MAHFAISTRVFFGRTAFNELAGYMKGLGLERLAFIADKNIENSEAFLRLCSNFERNGFAIQKGVFMETSGEPSYDSLDEFTGNLRGVDTQAIIAIGGGSVLDMAKGVGILLKNSGRGIDYRGMDKVQNPGIPVICIPTTAGTGSEVTHTASFIDTQAKTKLGINGRHVSPLCGALIPELLFSCPRKVAVSSGLDAMLHAIEAVSAKTANAATVMLGAKAFSLLYTHFKGALEAPGNYEAWEGMLLGSYLAGVAMMNAGGGPASGISYPLGVHFKVPHGIAGGIFLQHVFDYNISKGYPGYLNVYNCLPDADYSLELKKRSSDFADKFRKLYKNIGAPERLSEWGWSSIDVSLLTELTMEQRKANLELNPVPFGREEVKALLEHVV